MRAAVDEAVNACECTKRFTCPLEKREGEAISKNVRCNLFITMEGSFIFKWCCCSVSQGWVGWFDSPCLLSRLLLVTSSLLSFYSNDAVLTVTRQHTEEKVLSDNAGGTLNAAAP